MTDNPQAPSSGDPYKNLSKLITPGQAAALEAALFDVRRAGGFGRVILDLRAGAVKYISTEIRKPA